MRSIEFIDGNTGLTNSTQLAEELPASSREVYLLDGLRVNDFEPGCEVVAIARVVKLAVDESGQPVEDRKANRILITEYAEDGRLLRSTTMVRDPQR